MRMHGDARDQGRMALWIWLATLGGAFALAPLTESRAYIIVGFVSAGLVCLTGFGLRTLRAPWPATLLVQLLVLFWWATLTYAGDTTSFGVFPSAETIRALDDIVADAMQHSDHYAAPVPDNANLHALLAVSVGLLAVAVDLLAGSLQHAPAVGLVFLAVYMAPVALLSGHVSLWFFLPGALGFVFLLTAEERTSITRWGRNISYADSGALSQSRGIYSSGLASAGRRVGFGAVALSVVVPLVVPTLSTNLFGSGGIAGSGVGGDGSGEIQVGDPVILDMRRNLVGQSDRELVRMTGATTPRYVRLAALDSLSQNGWAVSERGPRTTGIESTLPGRPGTSIEVTRSTASFDVQVTEAFESNWLPTIYAPTSLGDVEGEWRIDTETLDVVAASDDTDTAGMHYRLNVGYANPTLQQLRNADSRVPGDLRDMLSLPAETPDVIRERAEQITEDARGPFEEAQAIEDWFRIDGGFEYTFDQANANGMETIENFVTDDRRGYCEQFASAMAMMARELDIPARVAVGFLSGDQVGDSYVFRGTDMHAWPELYFDDIGWVPFEPTPSDRTGTGIEYGVPTGQDDATTQTRGDGITNQRTAELNESNTANVDESDQDDSSGGGGGFPWLTMLTAALALCALGGLAFVPRWLRSVRRRRRWERAGTPVETAEAAWAELRDTVRDLRLDWPEGTTPRAVGRRLRPMLEARPHAVDALNNLVLAIERARYAEHTAPVELRDDVETIATALASRVSKKARRKALWLPASLLGGVPTLRRRTGTERHTHQELLALEE